MARSSENKTKPINSPVAAQKALAQYLEAVTPAGRKDDAAVLLDLMAEVTGEKPVLWGSSIVGFGSYHYTYDSGREGDSPLTGFAARKANMVVYVMPGFAHYERLLAKLGKHKTGASCLYLGRLSGIDLEILKELVASSVAHMRNKYPAT